MSSLGCQRQNALPPNSNYTDQRVEAFASLLHSAHRNPRSTPWQELMTASLTASPMTSNWATFQ